MRILRLIYPNVELAVRKCVDVRIYGVMDWRRAHKIRRQIE